MPHKFSVCLNEQITAIAQIALPCSTMTKSCLYVLKVILLQKWDYIIWNRYLSDRFLCLVPTLHMVSVYALLSEAPGANQIASMHLTHLSKLLETSSRGHYGKEKAIEIREAAKRSIGYSMPAKSLELQHTIRLISELDREIDEVEEAIRQIVDEMNPPLLTIPGISYRMGAMILAEIGDFSRFSSPDKILAYAGVSPSTYQSGQLNNAHAHMEKRGSRYLRYALFNAARYVCIWDPGFAAYLARKRAEGKHYYVAVSHAVKKLVRLIFALQKSGQCYRPAS